MACYHPVLRTVRGFGTLPLPCGNCIGCKQRTVRSWSLRCMHEAQLHPLPSSFVTLTYDDRLQNPSLDYRDFKRFMRRLVVKYGPTRFFVAGEYGSTTMRPHWHAILFGRPFPGGRSVGSDLRTHPELESLWPHGFSSIGEVTRESAAYVASYSVKSAGRRAVRYVDSSTGELLVSPFCRMSLKPGIGADWFKKYWREVYVPRDGVVGAGGQVSAPPRFYDKKLEAMCPELYEQKRLDRLCRSYGDNDAFKAGRVLSAELVALSKQKLKGRGL